MAALQKGQTVLVTGESWRRRMVHSALPSLTFNMLFSQGATGLIGAHVVEECLRAGLKVRATARSEEKAKKVRDVFSKTYGADSIETVIVEDFIKDNAFDEAVKGVHGVAHIASVLSFSDKWDDVVEPSVKGTLVALEAAAKESSVTRVVITSSSCALGMPSLDSPQTWDEKTWNDACVKSAKSEPNGWNVYAASKVMAERAGWDFVKNKKPQFALTTVNPNANFGHSHPASTTLSTNKWITSLAKGDTSSVKDVCSQWFINVTDVARLHVAGLVRDDVKDERVLGFTQVFTWREVLDLIKKIESNAPEIKDADPKWLDDKDQTKVNTKRMKEILGADHIADLELTIKQALGKAPVHPPRA